MGNCAEARAARPAEKSLSSRRVRGVALVPFHESLQCRVGTDGVWRAFSWRLRGQQGRRAECACGEGSAGADHQTAPGQAVMRRTANLTHGTSLRFGRHSCQGHPQTYAGALFIGRWASFHVSM